jgi:uncharacterized protein YcgI (DUF1989 family)
VAPAQYRVAEIPGGERYQQLAADLEARDVVDSFVVPREEGKGFVVGKGQILRVSQVEGPQVCDFNAWSLDDPKEMFWSGRTRILQKAHLTTGHQLWSTPPRMRPMFTIIADTVEHQPMPHGAASHDLIYSRCNARLHEVTEGVVGHRNCQDNLAGAIQQFDLGPEYVHDAFNIFMTTGIYDQDRLFILDPDSKQGDYIELYAEMDCIVAVSACPSDCSGGVTKPLGITIYSSSENAMPGEVNPGSM